MDIEKRKVPFKKNDIITLTITGMTADGNGVGKYDGFVIFVPQSAVLDVLSIRVTKVLKNHAFGIIEEITTPSKDRIVIDCPVFSKCGGCDFRHISYESELNIKSGFINDAFLRIAKLKVDVLPTIGCLDIAHYRNKAQYPVALDTNSGQAICGFYSRRSHRVVPFTDCKLHPPIFKEITDRIMNFVNEQKIPPYNEETMQGLLRHIYIRQGYYSGEIMLCVVVVKSCKYTFSPLWETLISEFPNIKSIVLNINTENTNVILGRKNITVWGADEISDTMCGNKFNLSPLAFYQVNTAQAERLYNLAVEFSRLSGDETLLELYCGVGTISLLFAKKLKSVVGVEIVPQAIENAKINAEVNCIGNAQFICGDAADIVGKFTNSPDIVLADPPRKGCDKSTLQSIVSMLPKTIVMISCNPATAARDVAFLCDSGYKVIGLQGVDLFARTTHVECLVLLTKT